MKRTIFVITLLIISLSSLAAAITTDVSALQVVGYVDTSCEVTLNRWDHVLPLDFDDPETRNGHGYVIGTWSILAYLDSSAVNIEFQHGPFKLEGVGGGETTEVGYTLYVMYPTGGEFTYGFLAVPSDKTTWTSIGGFYIKESMGTKTYSARDMSLMVSFSSMDNTDDLQPGLYYSDIAVRVTSL